MTNQQTSATVHHAIVKSVFSGDTLVIKPSTRSSANETEQRISLNYITAPKLARPPTDAGAGSGASVDEPYAFDTREFLRKKLVGRDICYTIDFTIPQSNRLMCTVYLGKDKDSGENIIESLISEGLVELRQQTGARANDPKYQRLVIIDEQAKSNKRGRYSDQLAEVHVRNMKWTVDNPKQFVDEHKSQAPLDAIVEFVRDGSTVRCLLLPSYYLVTLQLTGIKCPMLKREGGSSNEPNEPFAEEAKQYVDTRLLQRQVKVILDGVNNQNLVGTLLHPNGNIALHLLKEGLAKCVDWSLTLLQQGWREKYRATEKHAKDNRLRIWKNYVAQPGHTDNDHHTSNDTGAANGKSTDASTKGYQAKVLEVINGDALTIRDLRDNKVKKIYLSSVRAPRAADLQQKNDENNPNTNRQQIKRPLYEIPYLFEARELLRKRLVGKTVRVVTDYVQAATNDYPEKICCTVYAGNVNLGEALISKGLAKAVRHRQDDEQRSSHYDDLLTAEQQAEKRAVGLFSSGNGLHRIVDMTGDSNKERAKGLLSVLQRNGRMEGVVEFVASGSRFRVHLLKDNWIISFLLSSINCPRAERRVPAAGNPQQQKVEPGEPFGAEALTFSKEHFLQRDVFVEVENMDRGGNFIGRLSTADGQSGAFMLVQAGLAKVHDSAYGTSNYKQLLEAEDKCRKERIGVWTNYEEPTVKDDEENEGENNSENTPDEAVLGLAPINFNDSRFRRVVVTFITTELKVYVQYAEQGPKVEQLQSELRDVFNQTKPVGGHTPKKGELLAARFTADNEWYRARVEKIEGNNRISVYFVDYGNRELITDLSRLTSLPPGFTQLPGQAHECELAHVRPPPDEDDRQDAKNALLEEIGNDEFFMKVEYRQNNTEHISLYRASTKENVVKVLAEQGLIVIGQGRGGRPMRPTPLYDELQQAQAKAKSSRIGLWKYSDQIEDDATEFGFSGRK